LRAADLLPVRACFAQRSFPSDFKTRTRFSQRRTQGPNVLQEGFFWPGQEAEALVDSRRAMAMSDLSNVFLETALHLRASFRAE
jgi:hypothetical protein